MQFPPAPDHMYQYRGQTIKNFGYDNLTKVDYSFNSLGYRGLEFDSTKPPIILLGNSISFGLGVEYSQTFGGIIEQKLNCPVYNFSWGCYGHTNNEQASFLKKILKTIDPRYVIFQINNLNRFRNNEIISFDNHINIVVAEYLKFYDNMQTMLNTIPHGYLHWDNQTFLVDLPECLVYNKYHVDVSVITNADTFGIKSHKLIANRILQENI